MGNLRRIANVDREYFASIDHQDKAYWLGFLAADGSVGDKSKVTLALAVADCSHIEKFKFSLKGTQNVTTRYNGKYLKSRIVIRCQQLFDDLGKYGIIPNKTWSVRKPILSEDMIRHFWRGVFDGDGSIFINGNGQRIVNLVGNPLMINDFVLDCKNLGIDCRTNKHSKSNVLYANIGKQLGQLKFLDWIYQDANIYLDRKYAKYLEFKQIYNPLIPLKDKVSKEQLEQDYMDLGTWKLVGSKYGLTRQAVRNAYLKLVA